MTDRIIFKFAEWVGGWSGSLCGWAYGLQQRHDTRPKCLDCGIHPVGGPEDDCPICKEQYDRDREIEAAYNDGGADAWREAERELGGDPWGM